MRSINEIQIDERELSPLNDVHRKEESLTYFWGAVTEIALSHGAPEIYAIWRRARRHFEKVYFDSSYREEDFHALDVGLARVVIQKAKLINLPVDTMPRKKMLPQHEEMELLSFGDKVLSRLIRDLLFEAIEAFGKAKGGAELERKCQDYEQRMADVYNGTEYKRRDLSKALRILVGHYWDVVKLRSKFNGKKQK